MKIIASLIIIVNLCHGFIFLPFILMGMGGSSNHKLYIDVYPKNATIKIMNIKPKFKQGMVLNEGKYHLQITASGYKTIDSWIDLKQSSTYTAKLDINTTPLLSACDKNDTKACFNLALRYHQGEGLKQNFTKAYRYYEKGCNLADSKSCLNLGYLYYRAEGVYQNKPQAKKLFEKSCNLGNQKACNNIRKLDI